MMARLHETRSPRSLAGATILLAVPSLRDDRGGRAALDMGYALLRSGARTLVASSGGPLVGEFQALGGEWIDVDVAATGFLRRRKAVQRLAAFVRAERVDLVHAFGPAASRCAMLARRGTRAALVTSYDVQAPSQGGRIDAAQARGDRVIACSDFAASLIAERYSIGPDKFAVIPAAVDTAWFDPSALSPARVHMLRNAWQVRPEMRIVLAPGPMVPSAGHLTLVDAVRLLINGGLRGVIFVIAATAPIDAAYAAEVQRVIAAQGIGGAFRHTGHCADMPAAYAASDLVVLASETAALFSVVAGEAQAMARPVVGSDIGAMPELVLADPEDAPSRTGWLVRPGDAQSLARTLAEALSIDHLTMQKIGRQAREFAQIAFAQEQVAAATLAVYASLLQGDGAARANA